MLIILVVLPSSRGSLLRTVVLGALHGLITCATYDLTNRLTLEGWPLGVTFVNLLWGTFLCSSLVCAAGRTRTRLHALRY